MYKIQIQQKTLWNIKFLFYNNRCMILQLQGLIQLSQIYKNDASKALQVKIPRVQQQPNFYDCGLFAIANVVEFCFSPDSFNPRIIYDVSKMRQHLIECLENGKMSAFPKEKEKSRGKLNLFLQKHKNSSLVLLQDARTYWWHDLLW